MSYKSLPKSIFSFAPKRFSSGVKSFADKSLDASYYDWENGEIHFSSADMPRKDQPYMYTRAHELGHKVYSELPEKQLDIWKTHMENVGKEEGIYVGVKREEEEFADAFARAFGYSEWNLAWGGVVGSPSSVTLVKKLLRIR